MYTVKENPYAINSYRDVYISDLDSGFFYEDKQGKRYLVIGKKVCNGGYTGYDHKMFALNEPYKFCDPDRKYELRLLAPGEEIIFVQSEPIPF